MNTWGTIGLFVGIIGCLAFLVPYMIVVKRWTADVERVHVVVFTAVVLGLFLLYVLRRLFPEDVFQWIRLGALWLLALACVWRAAIFLAGLIRGVRRRRRAHRDVR
jgi:hypothetical protein